MSIPEERLAQIANRFAELEARLASGLLEGDAFVAASRDYAELEPVAKAAEQVRTMRGELAELENIDDPDPDIRSLAAEEVERIKADMELESRKTKIAAPPPINPPRRPRRKKCRWNWREI